VEPRAAADFIREIRAERGEEALTERPPVALAIRMVPGYRPNSPEALYDPSVLIYPIMDPIISALASQSGAVSRGTMSLQIPIGENPKVAAARRIIETAVAGTILPEHLLQTGNGTRVRDITSIFRNVSTRSWIQRVPANSVAFNVLADGAARHGGVTWDRFPYGGLIHDARAYGLITFKQGHGSLWFKAYTNNLVLPAELLEEVGPVDLNLRPIGRLRRDPRPLRAAAAMAVCEWAKSLGFELVDVDGSNAVAVLRHRLAHRVSAWSRPGRPAQAMASIGSRVDFGDTPVPDGVPTEFVYQRRYGNNGYDNLEVNIERASRVGYVDAGQLANLVAAGVDVAMHPSVGDVTALASAKPVVDDRLKPKQREAVGRHMATNVGYANFSDPGAGKTVMTLEAYRRRAALVAADPKRAGLGFRGLVIAEAAVRDQFSGESLVWFPEAITTTVTTASQALDLRNTLADAGDFPVVVITSYALATQVSEYVKELTTEDQLERIFQEELEAEKAQEAEAEADEAPDLADMPAPPPEVVPEVVEPDDVEANVEAEIEADTRVTLGEVLHSVHWDDITADEAACLRNMNSKQSRAMWTLRRNSDIAVALTGTPYTRSADDIGAIVAWSRNDRYMFQGVKLSEEFDLSDPEQVKEFGKAFGPIIFRMDEADFAEDLPDEKEPIIMELTPTPAELRLADASRYELARSYTELVDIIAQIEAANPDDPELPEIRAELFKVRGAFLGGMQLARMAASDPAALIGNESAGAALLEANGLISDATKVRGTKRDAVVKDCVKRIAEGERIIIFTEFATVARGLIADLNECGLRVGAILGGGGKKRDADVRAFQAGELDVIVSTSSGEKGLNLQTATTMVHYDLAWSPDSIIQRRGRIKRIGSTAENIQMIFPIMTGTIEDRVVAVVAARAIEMIRTLDSMRDEGSAPSLSGKNFQGLIKAANTAELGDKAARLVETAREILNIA
jgi:hypothetical protein